MIARLAVSGVLLLSLLANGIPCAGWLEARQAGHDCCMSGQCPEVIGSAHDPTSPAPADRCCAASDERNRRQSSQLPASGALVAAPLLQPAFEPHAALAHSHGVF